MSAVTWDATANVSWGKTYGFIEEGKDIAGIISESNAALKYFAPVSLVFPVTNLSLWSLCRLMRFRSLKCHGSITC